MTTRTFKPTRIYISIFVWLALTSAAFAAPRMLELELQTRDPNTNKIIINKEKFNPAKVGFVIVDLWNYHWCMTWTHQVISAVPRFNEAARAARKLGIQVLWAPSDAANAKLGWPQRERALAVLYRDVPKVTDVKIPFNLRTKRCHCGPGITCQLNYGLDDMPDSIDIAEQDLIVCGTQEMYSNCKTLGLTHLIYSGGATNICLTGKPAGLKPMAEAGLKCLIARDLSEAWTHYAPATGHTPETGNADAVKDVERAGIASIHLEQLMKRLGVWDSNAPVHEVRFAPWGKKDRPYLFEESVTVTLTASVLEKVNIYYTLDGTELTPRSVRYTKPLVLSQTTELRAAAFRDGQRISLLSDGYFVRLPKRPGKPQLYLDKLSMMPDPYARRDNPTLYACLWHPVVNQSYENKPLRVRRREYQKGLGMRAPANARYELKPEYGRFVALVGIDDNMLKHERGRNIALHSSVVFKVFIDGEMAAKSPVMRMSNEPWRFDVNIPKGSRQINLVCMDAGSRSPYDLGNWVEAGFVLR